MLKSQELALKSSELREAINKLTALETLTDQQTEALAKQTTELREAETKYRAAVVEEDSSATHEQRADTKASETADEKELRELRSDASLGRYLAAAALNRTVDGREAELTAALNLAPGETPLELFAPAREERLEDRAETDINNALNRKRWLDRLFGSTAAQYLGVTFDQVGVGQAVHTVTATGGTPLQRGREEAQPASAWTLSTKTFAPTRLTTRFEFAIEDAARVPGLEDALRRDMARQMAFQVDEIILDSDTGANEATADITGLLDLAAGVTEKEITQDNKVLYPATLTTFASLLDGKKASQLSDLKIVTSIPYLQLLLGTSANAQRNETVAQVLRNNGVSFRSRVGIGDATTNGKQLAAIGLGQNQVGAAVACFWPGVSLIRDQFSGASAGKVALTSHTLWNFGIVRAGHFARLKAVA